MLTNIARELGYEVYAVGGCVRDVLLGRPLGDLDLAVVGDAGKLAKLVAKKINAGKVAHYARYGTALISTDEGAIELATARQESYSPDSRKPSLVTACPIEDDLQRRDFTINALAFGLSGPQEGALLDLFDGWKDLKEHRLRTPLDPDDTFSDDPLRMLRAVRFAAQLGFDIAPETLAGIKRNVLRLEIVAGERWGIEFHKMLASPDPVRAMQLLIDTGLMAVTIPEVAAMGGVEQVGRHHHKDVLVHSLKVMKNVADATPDPILRLAGLLHDVGKPLTKRFEPGIGWTFHGHEALGAKMTYRIGRRLHIGRDSLRKLVGLVRLHMRPINLTDEGVTDSAIRRLMIDSSEWLDEQLILCRADITTANPKLVQTYLANFGEIEKRMADVNARDKMRSFQSPIRGEEIIELCGISAGPLVGALKGRVEDAILDGKINFDEDSARKYLLSIKDEVIAMTPAEIAAETRARASARRRVTSQFQFPGEDS